MTVQTGKFQADGTEKKWQISDLCYDFPGGPAGVRVCPTEALTLVTEDELGDAMERKRAEAARNAYLETHPQE